MARNGTAPIERMLPRKVVDQDGCWIWPGAANKVPDASGGGNYGQVRHEGKTWMVHRISYEYYVGSIPADMVVDHHCHNTDLSCAGNGCKHRRCWNPQHLRLVSFAQNCEDGLSPGAITKRTGVCQRGHPQTQANVTTWTRPSGTIRRACRLCANLSQQRVRAVSRGRHTSI